MGEKDWWSEAPTVHTQVYSLPVFFIRSFDAGNEGAEAARHYRKCTSRCLTMTAGV